MGDLCRERAVCDGVDEGAVGALDPASPKPEIRHRNNPAHARGQEKIKPPGGGSHISPDGVGFALARTQLAAMTERSHPIHQVSVQALVQP